MSLVGVKEFLLKEDGYAVMRIYVNCSGRESGSTLFVTATEEHFAVKTSRESAMIGVPLVAPITVGSKGETESQVKTHGETIAARGFYEGFYRAVQRELGVASKE